MSTPMKAERLATEKHEGQIKNNTDTPFIEHVAAVAARVATAFNDEAIVAAAWLHDILEDTDVTVKELRDQFPTLTVDIVVELTDKYSSPPLTYDEYRAKEFERMSEYSPPAIAIKFADRLDNLVRFANGYYNKTDPSYLASSKKFYSTYGDGCPWRQDFEHALWMFENKVNKQHKV